MEKEELFQKLTDAIIDGEDGESSRLALEAVQAGIDPLSIINTCLQPAMDKVGDDFQNGEKFLPELILAGDAAKAVLDAIMTKISGGGQSPLIKGTVVIGTLYGDNHDIGKNLVAALLSAYGFRVIDLGVNVTPKIYLETALKENANIIAASTLITTSLPYQREIAQLLRDSGQREKYFFIVGGGPVTGAWAKSIGADGYGNNAKDAVNLCTKLMTSGAKPPLAEPMLEGALQ